MANIDGLSKEFIPTQDQRDMISRMVAFNVTNEFMLLSVINPESKKPISRETFEQAFKDELANAKSDMHAMVQKKWCVALQSDDPAVWMPAAKKIEQLMSKGVYKKRVDIKKGATAQEELQAIRDALNQGAIPSYDAIPMIDSIHKEVELNKEDEGGKALTIMFDKDTVSKMAGAGKVLADTVLEAITDAVESKKD